MNILVLSAGSRNKVVEYFKREIGESGLVVATDCSKLAPAVYAADKFYQVPRIDDGHYLEIVLDICKKEKVDGVFSLIDPELSLLAEHREEFLAVGTVPIVSDAGLVEVCFDKFKMYRMLVDGGYATAESYVDPQVFYGAVKEGRAKYPVFVKPVRGSASMNINLVHSQKEVELLFELYEDLMIQELMDGTEYGADVYVDMVSGKVTSIFVKEKLKMRAGETDKAVSVKDEGLFRLIREFAEGAGFRGMIDIDLFKVKDQYYISEVNPRFGGGYPHAHECGVNMPAQILRNLAGLENSDRVGAYQEGIYMMKYSEVLIR